MKGGQGKRNLASIVANLGAICKNFAEFAAEQDSA
jgi:hypothetical protein